MRGKLHPSKTLFFREGIGKAKDSDGKEYEFCIGVSNGIPIVRSMTSGRWFTLGWDDILALAVEAGIDEPEPPEEEKSEKKNAS